MVFRTVTCYVILLATSASANLFAKPPATTPSQIGETLQLYLSADQGYRPGDLISRSQLEEFQTYLRATQGTQLATTSRWLNRTLPDSAALVTIFQRGGSVVLRPAAEKLGGYAELDMLARTGEGRKVIRQAITEKTPDSLVRWVLEKRPAVGSNKQAGAARKGQRARTRRIYTATEYLAAVSEALQESTVSGHPSPSEGGR